MKVSAQYLLFVKKMQYSLITLLVGEYVTEMREFIEYMQEAKMNAYEYNCQINEESCQNQCGENNDNGEEAAGDANYCYKQCMNATGMASCTVRIDVVGCLLRDFN
jgi:hypothetical protein